MNSREVIDMLIVDSKFVVVHYDIPNEYVQRKPGGIRWLKTDDELLQVLTAMAAFCGGRISAHHAAMGDAAVIGEFGTPEDAQVFKAQVLRRYPNLEVNLRDTLFPKKDIPGTGRHTQYEG